MQEFCLKNVLKPLARYTIVVDKMELRQKKSDDKNECGYVCVFMYILAY